MNANEIYSSHLEFGIWNDCCFSTCVIYFSLENCIVSISHESSTSERSFTVDKQVKSKTRVADHGEVFTAEREGNAMLDLVKHETERIESTFLDMKTPRLIQFNYSSADFAA